MKKLLSLITVVLFFSCSENTTTEEPTSDSKNKALESFIEETTDGYFAVYHFGESEMETDFIFNGADGQFYAQIRSGAFNNDATQWIYYYENLKNVKIEGNKFYSDKTNGEFIIDENGKYGLKLKNSWSAITEDDGSEFGQLSYSTDKYYAGNYKGASLKQLTEVELRAFTKNELELMRNEIFARYGYQFKPGGKMANYFKAQKWYDAHHKDVTPFLTEFEKENINLIKKVEDYALDQDLEYGIEDFPKEWHGLTKQDGEYVILQPCLASNEGFTIAKYPNGEWYVDVAVPFDTERYDIVEFEFTGNMIYQEYQGYFDLKDVNDGVKRYPFYWSKLKNYAEFDKFYNNTVRMVSNENKDAYQLVKEPCDEDEHY